MKIYRLLILSLVLGVTFGACKEKADPKAAATSLCACHEPVQSLQEDMKAAAGNTAKLTEIAKKVSAANKAASDCIQETVGNMGASLEKDGFKSSLLNEMKVQCPEAQKLYSRFVK